MRGALAGCLAVVLAIALHEPLLAQTRVTFTTGDGVPIVGTYYEPSHYPAPMVLLLHMPTRTRADWADLGARLAARGVGALAIDFRGHGESGRTMLDAADASSYRDELKDVTAALAWLEARPEAVPGRLGIVGASLAANLACLAAAGDPTVSVLVLLSATLDFRGVRPEAALRTYGDRPVLLIASLEDGYASRSARDLATAGTGVRELRMLENAGHGTMMLTREPELVLSLVDWLCSRLL